MYPVCLLFQRQHQEFHRHRREELLTAVAAHHPRYQPSLLLDLHRYLEPNYERSEWDLRPLTPRNLGTVSTYLQALSQYQEQTGAALPSLHRNLFPPLDEQGLTADVDRQSSNPSALPVNPVPRLEAQWRQIPVPNYPDAPPDRAPDEKVQLTLALYMYMEWLPGSSVSFEALHRLPADRIYGQLLDDYTLAKIVHNRTYDENFVFPRGALMNGFPSEYPMELLGNLYRPVLEDKETWKVKAAEAYVAWSNFNRRHGVRAPILFEARACEDSFLCYSWNTANYHI